MYKINYDTMISRINEDLDLKILKAKNAIRTFYNEYGGSVAISVSGGKDSTVLYHLVKSVYPNCKSIGVLGLENKHNIKLATTYYKDLIIAKPKHTMKWVVENKGYPVIGKKQSTQICQYMRLPEGSKTKNLLETGITSTGKTAKTYKMSKKNIEYAKKFKEENIKISGECCKIMKENAIRDTMEENGLIGAYIGIKITDSKNRQKKYQENTCLDFLHNSCYPIATFTDEDIDEYIKRYNLPVSEAYTIYGSKRTGCCICLMGIEHDRERFLRLKEMDYYKYKMAMDLGYNKILDILNIPY